MHREPFNLNTILPQAQDPARCKTCFYVLDGLESGTCPECGREFDFDYPSTFTRRTPLVRWRLWLPGLALSVGGGLALFAILMAMGNWGFAIWIAAPFSVGAILAYRAPLRWFWLLALVSIATAAVLAGVLTLHFMGVFCGTIAALIAIQPMIVGALLGWGLRQALKVSRFSQRSWLPVIGLVLLPLLVGVIEGPPPQYAPRVVTTSSVLIAPPADVWKHLVFYEQVERPRPLLLRLGLPTPLRTEGGFAGVGETTRCIYNSGYVTKRITELEAGRRLTFDVIEQDIHFEHDVRLISGRFDLHPTENGGTSLQLTTVYEPLVAPRWLWQYIETTSVHTLHEHVIEDIRQRCVSASMAGQELAFSSADSEGGGD